MERTASSSIDRGQPVHSGSAARVRSRVCPDPLRSAAKPLEAPIRSSMERAFGYDFSRVRVFNDRGAARSAGEFGARAYTVGERIVFGAGQYEPTSAKGRRLIAHELAHVVQQRKHTVASDEATLSVSDPLGSDEREADRIASEATIRESMESASRPVLTRHSSAPLRVGDVPRRVQRQPIEVELRVPTPKEQAANRRLGVNLPRVSATIDPRRDASYIEQRLEAVGYSVYLFGYLLFCRGLTLPLYVPESIIGLTLDNASPISAAVYPSYKEAIADLPYGPLAPGQAFPYAYFQVAGVVMPTTFSRAATPRTVQTMLNVRRELAETVTRDLSILALTLIGGRILLGAYSRVSRVGTGEPGGVPGGGRSRPGARTGSGGGVSQPETVQPPPKTSAPPKRTAPSEPAARGRQTGGGNVSASARAQARSEPKPEAPLPRPQQQIREVLIKEHPGLNPKVAREASRGGAKAMGPGGAGADVRLVNGGGREVSVHNGAATPESIGTHLQGEAAQAGTTEIYLQINSATATRTGILRMIPQIRNAYPELRGITVRIFGPDGATWWKGVFGGP